MHGLRASVLASAALAVACDSGATRHPAGRTLYLKDVATFAPDGQFSGEAGGCRIGREVIDEIEDEIEEEWALARIPSYDPRIGGYGFLDVEIYQMSGDWGGIFAGPKSITLRGQLVQQGMVVASFYARREIVGGGIAVSPCAIIEGGLDELAEDIGRWLERPTMHARLGEY